MNCVRILTELLGLAVSGVYGVFDEAKMEVFVSCSNNILKGVASVVTLIRDKDHICSNMVNPEIRVLFLGPDQRHRGTQIIRDLESRGYKVLNHAAPVLLRAKVRNLQMGMAQVAVVTLRSSRGSEKIVAAFSDPEECSRWTEEWYPGGLVTDIVRLDSKLTQEVLEHYEG